MAYMQVNADDPCHCIYSS